MNVDETSFADRFFADHPSADVLVDFNDLDGDELLVRLCDFRDGVVPQIGDVLVAGCWGATPAKAQVIEVSDAWARLRLLD